jgi:ABC-type multidrug transport system ATPase subunit
VHQYGIEVRGLSKTYNSIRAVRDVSFTVRKGEIFGFLGPNGAGKTTTIKSILGLIHPDTGLILINGYSIISEGKKAKKGVGYLPERVAFYDNLTAYQNLCFYADLRGISREECKPLLKEFDLPMDKKVGTFSKGMKQRLGVIRAVIGDPSILILDEPSIGLDPRGVALVRKKILQMKEKGSTIFVSSHILSEIQAVCDRVAIINKGVIVAEDTIEKLGYKLRLKPKLFLELENSADEFVEGIKKIAGVEGVTARGRVLEVICEPRAKVDVILKINRMGGNIIDVKTEEPSLEDVFLRYTEE